MIPALAGNIFVILTEVPEVQLLASVTTTEYVAASSPVKFGVFPPKGFPFFTHT